MALYVTRPRRDEERIGRGLPIGPRSDVVYGIYRGLPSGIKHKRLSDPDYVKHGANSAVESRATDNKRT